VGADGPRRAITDLVQHAFGPVDLDRSAVELATVAAMGRGCPACAGRRFGFPGELAEAKAAMCPTHVRQADSVVNGRLARANASNPDGWAAITAASLAILPHGLAARLPRADSSSSRIPVSSPSAPTPSSKRPGGSAAGRMTSPWPSGRNPQPPICGPSRPSPLIVAVWVRSGS
jgi:hypothetical protein